MEQRQDILSKRTGFLFYFDWSKYVSRLTHEQAGCLLEAILKLAMDGEDTDFSDDMALDLVFIGIRDTILRDTEKYVEKAKKNRENGQKGGRPPKPTDNPEKPNGYFGFSEETQRNPQKPDRDIDIDIDRETDIDRDIDTDNDTDIDMGQDDYVFHDGTCRKYAYEMFIEKWNMMCKYNMRKITSLTDKQKSSIDQIIINYDFNTLLNAMDKANDSDYLIGKDKNSGMNVDFFVKMASFEKIMIGFYDNKN